MTLLEGGLIVLALATFLGGLMQGLSGIGFGLIVASLLGSHLDLSTMTIIIMSISSVLSLRISIKYRQYIKWRGIALIIAIGIPFRLVATLFDTKWGTGNGAKITLGVTLLLLALLSFLTDALQIRYRQTPLAEISVGLIGGIVGGVFGVGGPIYALYFLWRYQNKQQYNASLQMVFLSLNIVSLVSYSLESSFQPNMLLELGVGLVTAVVGLMIGLAFFERINTVLAKRIAYAFILLSSGWLVLSRL